LERNTASGLGELVTTAEVHRGEVHEHVRMLEAEERLIIRVKVRQVADDTRRKEVLKDLSPAAANENEVTTLISASHSSEEFCPFRQVLVAQRGQNSHIAVPLNARRWKLGS
jgi:hypothetical protein